MSPAPHSPTDPDAVEALFREVLFSDAAMARADGKIVAQHRSRAEGGVLLDQGHRNFVEQVLETLRPGTEVHELGSGSGLLALHLHLLGFPATNIAGDARRAAFSTALAEGVRGAAGPFGERFRICAIDPVGRLAHLLPEQSPGAVLVSSNCMGTRLAGAEGQTLDMVAHYDAAVVDLARFTTRREGKAVAALRERFAKRGLVGAAAADARIVHLVRAQGRDPQTQAVR